VALSPDDLLYLIYTSGSTGLPKGAAITHANELNLLDWYCAEYQMRPADKTLIISALGFDLSQKNLFALLCVGGTVVFNEQSIYDPEHIRRLIQQHGISLLNCAPSAFYPLAEKHSDYAALESLRCVLLGGESIQLKNIEGWISQAEHHCQIVNMYGPTECTDIAASFTLERARDYLGKTIPIGKPNANVELYVLDSEQQILPAGIAGELYIGGAGVGAGYFNKPELTAERFILNPFSDSSFNGQSGSEDRLYRSGDLVRYRKDGTLEYLDRIDQQVKIRGYRIELDEIESALKQINGVKQAVVAAKTMGNNEHLVAYVVKTSSKDRGHAPLNKDGVKRKLRQALPAFMVPDYVEWIETIPLSANGKTDRASLPLPSVTVRQTISEPQTDNERLVQAIWLDLLERSSIDIDDNFFDLGGNSLLAVKAIRAIEQQCAIQLPVSELFNAQSIRALAALIDLRQAPWSPLSLMNQPADNNQAAALFLVHPIGGMSLCYRQLADKLGNERPIYGIQARGFEDGQTPFTALEAMAGYYLDEIKHIQPQGPYLLGGQSFGGLVAFEMARQLRDSGEHVQELIMVDTHPPSKLTQLGMNTDAKLLGLFLTDVIGEIDLPLSLFGNMDRQTLIEKVRAHTQDLFSTEQLERMFAVLEGFREMQLNYEPSEIDVAIHLIRPEQEIKGLVGRGKRLIKRDIGGDLGWSKLSSAELAIDVVPGKHHSVLREPHVSELAKIIKTKT
jgi:aspartate racemase